MITKATGAELRYFSDPARSHTHRERVTSLQKLSDGELLNKFTYTADHERPSDPSGDMNRKMIGELFGRPEIAQQLNKAILDSTGGYTTGGSIFIRQDLEAIVHALFVRKFPLFDLLPKGESNGLTHVANQQTATDTNALGSTLIAETGAISYVSGVYNRQSYPIAVFGTGRGVTFKDLAAVKAGGASVQPLQTELAAGVTALTRDVQYTMFQGNASNNAITSSTNEGGAYNGISFDGLRGVVGGVGTFATNNAIQIDMGTNNFTESLQNAAAQLVNNGGDPSVIITSALAKQAFDTENQNNVRYQVPEVQVAGTSFKALEYMNGQLPILPVPGTTLGSYYRTSDGAKVEDAYILDTNHITIRWLYSDTFTVLEIPSGVDGILSTRYLIFGLFGLEMAAPPFTAKVRRVIA